MLYGRCLALDPSDSVAAYNRANCFRALGEGDEAARGLCAGDQDRAGLRRGLVQLRRRCCATRARSPRRGSISNRAIAIDPDYADAIYNLASLEFDAGDLSEARAAWVRYLELDQDSEWAKTATRGIAFVDLNGRKSAG